MWSIPKLILNNANAKTLVHASRLALHIIHILLAYCLHVVCFVAHVTADENRFATEIWIWALPPMPLIQRVLQRRERGLQTPVPG